jgi:L-aminopeptidase/D-esterase-like protein
VRTGVTVLFPTADDPDAEPVFAGCHRLNGNGELTGLEWVRESGLLTSPIALTSTHRRRGGARRPDRSPLGPRARLLGRLESAGGGRPGTGS